MSTQSALGFINKVRDDEDLRTRIWAIGGKADAQTLIELGTELGFLFTSDELQAAFRYDWGMRSLCYGPSTPDK